MSIYFDNEEPIPVRKNDPSRHTVSVGYNGKDNIVVTIMADAIGLLSSSMIVTTILSLPL